MIFKVGVLLGEGGEVSGWLLCFEIFVFCFIVEFYCGDKYIFRN